MSKCLVGENISCKCKNFFMGFKRVMFPNFVTV